MSSIRCTQCIGLHFRSIYDKSLNLYLIHTIFNDDSTDWLIDRRHCKTDWRDQILPIREKINNAIQDMPENDEIKQLLSGTCESLLMYWLLSRHILQ